MALSNIAVGILAVRALFEDLRVPVLGTEELCWAKVGGSMPGLKCLVFH